jgi:hypothetical protein
MGFERVYLFLKNLKVNDVFGISGITFGKEVYYNIEGPFSSLFVCCDVAHISDHYFSSV